MIVGLQFYPNQKNPARASGRGVYRVVAYALTNGVEPAITVAPAPSVGRHPTLYLRTQRGFKHGSRVDPLKIALDAARKRA